MINPDFQKPLQLGKGSYGCVWSNNKEEAVKITDFDSWDKVQSTVREVHALRHLNHEDNEHLFVRMKKVRYKHDQFHLFMERADMNLHDIKTSDLSADTIEKWAIQMFSTIQFMSKRKIFHRDIKPENILVKRNNIFFCDFGLSRQLHSDAEHGTGYIVTRWYRSIELLRHQQTNKRKANLCYTEKMDTWSVAAILYELIFDKILAPGKSIEDAIKYVERRVPRLQKCKIEDHEKITVRMAKCLKGVLKLDPKKRSDATHALYSLGVVSAEKYIEHQAQVLEKKETAFALKFAELQPPPDQYTSDEWNKRQTYVLQAYKKFPKHKKIIAYAIVVLDSSFTFDLKTSFAESIIYASLVLGSYYNDETCRKLIKTYRQALLGTEDKDLFDRVAEMLCDLETIELSIWESKRWKSFSNFLGEVLKNPLKKIKH